MMEHQNSEGALRYRVVDMRPASQASTAPQISLGQAMRAAAGIGGRAAADVRAALSGGTGGAGGYLLPDELSTEIVRLTSQAQVCVSAGARVIQLVSDDLSVARVKRGVYAAWRLENGSVAEDDPQFEKATLKPRSLAVLVKVSRELLEDAYDIDATLTDTVVGGIAGETDRVCIEGSGVDPEPLGVVNNPGVFLRSPSVVGGDELLGWYRFVEAFYFLQSGLHPSRANALMVGPTLAYWLDAMVSLSSGKREPAPKVIADLPRFVTYGLTPKSPAPADLHRAIVGDFTQLLIGWRGDIRVELLRERFADTGQVAFLVHCRMGVELRRPGAFAVVGGIKAPTRMI